MTKCKRTLLGRYFQMKLRKVGKCNILCYNVYYAVQGFESVNKILKRDHSNNSY